MFPCNKYCVACFACFSFSVLPFCLVPMPVKLPMEPLWLRPLVRPPTFISKGLSLNAPKSPISRVPEQCWLCTELTKHFPPLNWTQSVPSMTLCRESQRQRSVLQSRIFFLFLIKFSKMVSCKLHYRVQETDNDISGALWSGPCLPFWHRFWHLLPSFPIYITFLQTPVVLNWLQLALPACTFSYHDLLALAYILPFSILSCLTESYVKFKLQVKPCIFLQGLPRIHLFFTFPLHIPLDFMQFLMLSEQTPGTIMVKNTSYIVRLPELKF